MNEELEIIVGYGACRRTENLSDSCRLHAKKIGQQRFCRRDVLGAVPYKERRIESVGVGAPTTRNPSDRCRSPAKQIKHLL